MTDEETGSYFKFHREVEKAIAAHIERTRGLRIGGDSNYVHDNVYNEDKEVVYKSGSWLDRMTWALEQPYGFGLSRKNEYPNEFPAIEKINQK